MSRENAPILVLHSVVVCNHGRWLNVYCPDCRQIHRYSGGGSSSPITEALGYQAPKCNTGPGYITVIGEATEWIDQREKPENDY